MPGALLVPVHVDGRVVAAATTAPPLYGSGDTPMPAGVHLHWALPDALSRARVVDRQGGSKRILFPAIPDLWLVVRFNPAPSQVVARPTVSPASPAGPHLVSTARPTLAVRRPVVAAWNVAIREVLNTRRSWRAWIVESRSKRAVKLEGWTPPAAPDYQPGQVLTVQGLLPVAESEPGWGLYPERSTQNDLGVSGYYPECPKTFGLHDPLDDNVSGVVSYAVVGWYRYLANDPYRSADDREELFGDWKFTRPPESCPVHQQFLSFVNGDGDNPGYLPPLLATQAAQPARTAVIGNRVVANATRTMAMRAAFTDLTRATGVIDADAVLAISPDSIQPSGPDHLLCHGALVEVNTKSTAQAGPTTFTARVFSTMQTALGEVATKPDADPVLKAAVQALILDVDQKLVPTGDPNNPLVINAGLIGLPNDLHALGFQGRPGKPKKYGQLDIHRPSTRAPRPGLGKGSHWPLKAKKLTTLKRAAVKFPFVAAAVKQAPPYPKLAAVEAWVASIKQTLSSLGVDTHLLRVVDDRGKPPKFAERPSTSPQGRAFWVNLDDVKKVVPSPPAGMPEVTGQVADLLMLISGASISMPDKDSIFEVPGPRWYRPWSPYLVLHDAGRSYRHGADGRFDPDGYLECRPGGDTLASANVKDFPATDPVTGDDLLRDGAKLSLPGLPTETRNLLGEALLLDSTNAAHMARLWLTHFKRDHGGEPAPAQADVEKAFKAQVQGAQLLRDFEPESDALATQEEFLMFQGVMPSPIAFQPWAQAWAPVFANITYSFQPAAAGALDTVDVGVGAPTGAAAIQHTERRLLTPALAKVLESAVVSRSVVDRYGNSLPVKKLESPLAKQMGIQGLANLDSDKFLRFNVISAPLAEFDQAVFDGGVHLRAGTLTVSKVEVVDAFGSVRTVQPNAQTVLNPRMPNWSRVQFRMFSATGDGEADQSNSPVCGYLMPDLLEHALEVYDGDGVALGQLRGIPLGPGVPVKHSPETVAAQAPSPGVEFEPHKWQTVVGDDVLSVVENPYLKQFVSGVLNAACTEINPQLNDLRESAVGALLRVIDTVRATVEPEDKSGERRVRLLGAPIAIVRSRMWLERTAVSIPTGDPPLLDDPVTIPVKVGHISQPDDGLLGCFVPASTEGGTDARFRPVDKAALEALWSGLADAVPSVDAITVNHGFLHDPAGADTTYTLLQGEQRELLMLVDLRGGVYLTTGVNPRKKISLPREFLDGAYKKLQPSFDVGPVFTVQERTGERPILPVPTIAGYLCQWVEEGSTKLQEIPPLPEEGVLPAGKCAITDGWLNLTPS